MIGLEDEYPDYRWGQGPGPLFVIALVAVAVMLVIVAARNTQRQDEPPTAEVVEVAP